MSLEAKKEGQPGDLHNWPNRLPGRARQGGGQNGGGPEEAQEEGQQADDEASLKLSKYPSFYIQSIDVLMRVLFSLTTLHYHRNLSQTTKSNNYPW